VSVATVPLGELCDILSGFAWSASKFNQDRRGVPIIRIQNVDQVSDNDFVYWDEPYDERFVIRQDDLLLTLSGSFRIESWSGPDALLNQRIIKLTPSPELDRGWLLHVLRPRLGQIELLGKHALVNNVSLGDIRSLAIPLPPLVEQRRIAEVLDRAEALRAKRRAALAQLDSLTQSIFLDLFGDPVTKGWAMTDIAGVVKPIHGSIRTGPFGSQLLHSEFTDHGIAVLGIDNAVANEFRWGERRFISEAKYRQLKRYTVRPGDVLITIMGTCGRCAVVPDDIPTAINTKHLCCITLDLAKCLPIFLHAYFLQHPTAQKYLNQTAKGAIMFGLNMGLIKGMPVLLPPIELQREFVRRVGAVEKLKTAQRASLADLDALFASLQHRAFRGEL